MANEEPGVQELARRLLELEKENARLQDKQKKQELGKAVLDHLQNKGSANEKVLKAVEVVQRVYANFEIRFDPKRQAETIYEVRRLREELVSAMDSRNTSGSVHLAAIGAQVAFCFNPVLSIGAGILASGANAFSLFKRADVEMIWRRIKSLLEADFRRFERLVEAIEALDAAWKENFEYSIHTARFRELCYNMRQGNQAEGPDKVDAVIAGDPKLRGALLWFAKDVVWKNLKLILTSRYLYSIIELSTVFMKDPKIHFLVPGLFAACQVFLLVEDYFSDISKLDEIDEGILRMKEQLRAMRELINE